MKKTKDIFISYKRSDGENVAKQLYQELANIGYSVFLDTEILQNGKYEGAIIDRIENSTDFIIIVTPTFANDEAVIWIKKELDCALKSGCNIIPVYYTQPSCVAQSISYLNDYNGIRASECEIETIIAKLVGTFIQSNQDISFKEDPRKDGFTNLKDYLHRHTVRAFIEIAVGAFEDGELHDSNYTIALMAQESDYDIITCMWAVLFKCNQILQNLPEDLTPQFGLIQSLLKMMESTLGDYAILIDEGKMDTANRFLPKARELFIKIIELIVSDNFD